MVREYPNLLLLFISIQFYSYGPFFSIGIITKKKYRNQYIDSNEQTRSDSGKENHPEMICGRSLKRNQTQKIAHALLGDTA